MEEVKRSLSEMVLAPLYHPDLFARLGITPPRGILLHGPPGCGKTHTVRALVAEVDARSPVRVAFFSRKGADCLGKYHGDAERTLRLLFDQVGEGCVCSGMHGGGQHHFGRHFAFYWGFLLASHADAHCPGSRRPILAVCHAHPSSLLSHAVCMALPAKHPPVYPLPLPQARLMAPSIIFLDELDALVPPRSVRAGTSDQIYASVVATLLACMDGAAERGQVVVIAATNRWGVWVYGLQLGGESGMRTTLCKLAQPLTAYTLARLSTAAARHGSTHPLASRHPFLSILQLDAHNTRGMPPPVCAGPRASTPPCAALGALTEKYTLGCPRPPHAPPC